MSALSFPLLESTESGDDTILISPWRIYDSRPTSLSGMLGNGGQKKTENPNSEINFLMYSGSSDARLSGQLDQFCNMWVIKCENNNDIDICLEKLQLKYSLLHVNLVERKVFKDTIEIPMLIFINNESEAIETLKNNLNMVKEAGPNGKHFSYEIDYGPAVEKWASDVLKRDFVCIGGRFCITNSDSFNHVLDWNNILGCLVCLPCGLMAGSAYRIGRKACYLESMWTPKQDVILVGAKARDGDSQRETLLKLIEWMSEDPEAAKPPQEQSPAPELTTITEESEQKNHGIKGVRNQPSTSGMPEVDSDSKFKKTFRYDPLSYPRLMSFLAADKTTDASKNKDTKKLNASRKISVRPTDHGKNRRPLLKVRDSVGESKV
ncbi:hypothetical protein LOTGIDRAFT_158130 [Lottia gigantea]|uniref:Uncharacterized protein n=1 Tax=Lottia gigantea TaxID=225164 RepID=V4AY43_LOTGI|nr:hypothetical protein LOTGIDRAFT_158130 [Lottia gigantea]ESO99965.1 hypothetical protein LOTGIDRAFT_158130 [Lottia gigantea]